MDFLLINDSDMDNTVNELIEFIDKEIQENRLLGLPMRFYNKLLNDKKIVQEYIYFNQQGKTRLLTGLDYNDLIIVKLLANYSNKRLILTFLAIISIVRTQALSKLLGRSVASEKKELSFYYDTLKVLRKELNNEK